MIYLDSNIFIYASLNLAPESEKCRKILSDVVNKRIDACTSILTWDEFFYSVKKKFGSAYASAESEKLLNFLNLTFLDADFNTIFLAQKINAKYNLGPRDAIHAATAIINKCDSIITDDSDFDKIKEIKRQKP